MSEHAEQDQGYTVRGYFELVERRLIDADDHVELLEGMVVASPPQGPMHASVIMRVSKALMKAVGDRASVRSQLPFLVPPRSVPEPDFALVAGDAADYRDHHPDQALLVIEIADSSLPEDRLTKSRIYARAGVPEYWIVNIRDRRVEIHTSPDIAGRVYLTVRCAEIGETTEIRALPGAVVAVADLFPGY